VISLSASSLYIDTTSGASIQSGFDLKAPANAPAGTPEPASIFLMGGALVGLGLIAKKRASWQRKPK
jgi:hypothetical protein